MFHVHTATKDEIGHIVRTNVSRESNLQTDEAAIYTNLGKEFKGGHDTVNHSKGEYVRSEFTWTDEGPKTEKITTNTIENVFSVFKRGMKGVYQHCGEAHLHRYLAEFDFRYNRRSALGIGTRNALPLRSKASLTSD